MPIGISVMPDDSTAVFSELQDAKACMPTLLTLFGRVSEVSPVCAKAEAPIVSSPFGRETVLNG